MYISATTENIQESINQQFLLLRFYARCSTTFKSHDLLDIGSCFIIPPLFFPKDCKVWEYLQQQLCLQKSHWQWICLQMAMHTVTSSCPFLVPVLQLLRIPLMAHCPAKHPQAYHVPSWMATDKEEEEEEEEEWCFFRPSISIVSSLQLLGYTITLPPPWKFVSSDGCNCMLSKFSEEFIVLLLQKLGWVHGFSECCDKGIVWLVLSSITVFWKLKQIFWFWCSVSDTKSYLPGAAGSGNLETQECCFQSVPTWMQRWLQQGNLWWSSPNRCA